MEHDLIAYLLCKARKPRRAAPRLNRRKRRAGGAAEDAVHAAGAALPCFLGRLFCLAFRSGSGQPGYQSASWKTRMTLAAAVRRSGLDALSARASNDSVEFPHFLANHAPMVLVALDKLGASPERTGGMVRNLSRQKWSDPLSPTLSRQSTRATWEAALGGRAREADYRDFFAEEVQRLGIAGAVQTLLAEPHPGRGRERNAPDHAIGLRDPRARPREVGVALAYWAACYLPLPAATGSSARKPRIRRRCWPLSTR